VIVTLTANPSLDRTVNLTAPLERGAVQRAQSVISQAGGKGVNISRACVAADLPSIAVLPAAKGDPFVLELLAAGIDCRPVEHEGDLRVNITITEPDGTTTKLNSPGPRATERLLAEFQEALVRRAATADWIVLAGSLPPGTPPGWYADLVSALRTAGGRVAVDTSEEPLQALVEAIARKPECAPHLMKPNGAELASVTGHEEDELEADPAAAAEAARDLVGQGVESVLVTLGPRGAVLVSGNGAWHAVPPPVSVVSTVGAGDSSLFGYLLGDVRGHQPDRRLALAVAYGSAAAGLPGTTIPHPRQVHPDQVHVTPLDLPASG
jgi:1-phosphofructokinase